MSKILNIAKYSDVVALSGEAAAEKVSETIKLFETTPQTVMKSYYGADRIAGMVFLLSNPKYPRLVIEHVQGLNGDSVSTLFEGHAIFETLGNLIAARKDLIGQLESSQGAKEGTMRIKDDARGRVIFLQEISTAQLIDLVQKKFLAS